MSHASDLKTTGEYTINDIPPSNVALWSTIMDVCDVPHVMPDFGRQHATSMSCWCHPIIDDDRYEEPGVVVHNVAQ